MRFSEKAVVRFSELAVADFQKAHSEGFEALRGFVNKQLETFTKNKINEWLKSGTASFLIEKS